MPHPEDEFVLCVTNNKINGFTVEHLRYKDTFKLVHEEWCHREQRYLGEKDLSDWHEVSIDWSRDANYAQYHLRFQVEAIERNARHEAGLSNDVWDFNYQTTSTSSTLTAASLSNQESNSSLCTFRQPSIQT